MSDSRDFKEAIEKCLSEGYHPPNKRVPGALGSAVREAARRLLMPHSTLGSWLELQERRAMLGHTNYVPDWRQFKVPTFELPEHKAPEPILDSLPIGTTGGPAFMLVSREDNTYCFGAFGDLHAGSKYTRWDVREGLTREAESAGAQVIFDTGNWIDGESRLNRHDLEAHGLDNQVKLLAERYPKTELRTLAVTGADHEGWYVKAEGIDVGRYCESIMCENGHNWVNLGYMQADIVLRNANSGATAILRVMHPGGGTGYALSYRPQKIIESFEGGEKPAVLLLGHYHKLDPGIVRNVWYLQTGCGQDQTPFMAQRAIEAHVGGGIVTLQQDPETGAITRFRPDCIRYFNKRYYFQGGLANNRWSGSGKIDPAPRMANAA